jgi:hypothetical protein
MLPLRAYWFAEAKAFRSRSQEGFSTTPQHIRLAVMDDGRHLQQFVLNFSEPLLLQQNVLTVVSRHFKPHAHFLTGLFSRPTTTDFFAAGDIYATAFAAANSFHYTLSIMQDTQTCTKDHAAEPARGNLVFEARDQTLVASLTLCVAE